MSAGLLFLFAILIVIFFQIREAFQANFTACFLIGLIAYPIALIVAIWAVRSKGVESDTDEDP
jgi:CDP-diglyceride synthetase